MSVEQHEEHIPDMLPLYYKRLFPSSAFIRWLSYGKVLNLKHREFSFTLADDIYIRFQSFQSHDEFMQELYKMKPVKIDIGAIYNNDPSKKKCSTPLKPEQRELVLDIDITDYDDVRTCCSGTNVCNLCWKFMKIATKVLDNALREDFGFKNILWVFSGRRGIHCWVCDKEARMYPEQVRNAIVDFLHMAQSINSFSRKFTLWGSRIHYSIQRALDIIKPYFKEIVQDQDFLGNEDKLKDFLKHADSSTKEKYEVAMKDVEGTEARWKAFVDCHKNLMKLGQTKRQVNFIEEMMLYYAYPRLDVNVTKSMNHLLKAPFCVHPKSGKVAIPFNPKAIDKFDLDAVPNLSTLTNEIHEHDKVMMKEEENNSEETKQDVITTGISTIADFKKTSLLKPVRIFEEFIRGLDLSEKDIF